MILFFFFFFALGTPTDELVEGTELPTTWMHRPIITWHTWVWFMSICNEKKKKKKSIHCILVVLTEQVSNYKQYGNFKHFIQIAK